MDQPWASFISRFKWYPGEYITILGPKGYGKTTLLLELSKRRRYIVIFANKVKDRTLSNFISRNNFKIVRSWDKVKDKDNRLVLWPEFDGIHSFKTQAHVFRNAITGTKEYLGIFKQGGWSIALDEMLYLTGSDGIGLDSEVKMLYTQGRSNDISLLAGSQRPRDIPQHMLSQADHFFFFRYTDRYELDRLAGVTGNMASTVREIVPSLRKHEFMYINRETDAFSVSRVER